MAQARIFFSASQEHFPPEDLLEQAVAAARAGFEGIASSDHLQPWWEPGESGHTWPWLGAAGARVDDLPVGTAVTPVARRYHPALIAQAWMTLERLFPGRPFLGVGSGEALNEVPVGDDWPSPADQVERLAEGLSIIRRLWAGETVSEEGRFYRTQDTKLHTIADRHPPIWVSAFGPKAAAVAAEHGDGLWCLADPEMAPGVIEAYRAERERLGHDQGEIVLSVLVSWARSDEEALAAARQWKGAQPSEFYSEEWHDPQAMREEGERQLSDEELAEKIIASADPDVHAERLQQAIDLGATIVCVQNNSGADPLGAIETYGEHVLPALRGSNVRHTRS
jgi:coenzyme F420-dependent glucose-6-phosphate dehydrogenase